MLTKNLRDGGAIFLIYLLNLFFYGVFRIQVVVKSTTNYWEQQTNFSL